MAVAAGSLAAVAVAQNLLSDDHHAVTEGRDRVNT